MTSLYSVIEVDGKKSLNLVWLGDVKTNTVLSYDDVINSAKTHSTKITKLLEEQGINVARRTIAKYRESLSIPPSNERKRLV